MTAVSTMHRQTPAQLPVDPPPDLPTEAPRPTSTGRTAELVEAGERAARTPPAGSASTIHAGQGPLPARAAEAATCSVRPAPQREPGFDDEPPARHLSLVRTATAPQLPFPTPRPDPAPIRRLSLVPDPPEDDAVATQHPPSAGRLRPDPARFSRQFAQGVLEVLSGRRPMVQLARHVSPAVQRGLIRAGDNQALRSPNAPVLHSLHLSEPAEGVCEMSATIVVGTRYRALAARLEWKMDHWRCTALQMG